jgi:5,5'-dehydrodivanillate O-demethylase oxygenase subunit
MLSKEQNETLTRVDPGSPMGELLRRYWMPIAGASEFDHQSTKRVRLLGEDLVLYKDLSGSYGLVDRHCPHRRADMANGIPEQCGLRCAYHGWMFNETGACIEQPYEDVAHPGLKMRDKIQIKAYPVEERAGLLWAYMGPGPVPLVPNWEPFTWENGFVQVTISEIPCNWLQGQENSIDPVHFEWAHDNFSQRTRGDDRDYGPRHVKVAFDEFDYGFVYRRVMEGRDETHVDWTIGRVCLWPNCLFTGHNFQWRVPIDNETTLSVLWTFNRVPKEREPYKQKSIPTWYGPIYDEQGEWIDSHVTNQDIIAWIGQGVIADRTKEHLGQSDKGIVLMRQRFFADMKTIQESDKDPKAVVRDEAVNDCIALPILNRDEHINGSSYEEIERSPLLTIMHKRFIIQAGQPGWVREQYEEAMGLKLIDEAGLPGRFHV